MDSSYATYTDDLLLNLWKQKDQAAFEQFYYRYFLKLVNVVYRKTHDQHSAEEIANDTFLALYLNSEKIKNNPIAYCRAVLKNKIADYFRGRPKIRTDQVEELVAESRVGTSLPIEAKELEEQILRQIEALPEQCRRVFIMRRAGKLSNQEVAAELGISVKTVENHMTKALSLLKQNLDYCAYIGFFLAVSPIR